MLSPSHEREVTSRGLAPEAWRARLESAPEPAHLPVATGDSVTIVAPHPDDESLGTGGLLQRLVTLGARVSIVVVTDGTAGYPGCGPEQEQTLSSLRRSETYSAAISLGLCSEQVTFLGYPDGSVGTHQEELTDQLTGLLRGSALCLAPWLHDPHPDHQAVGRAAFAATSPAVESDDRPGRRLLWQYPIWMRHSVLPGDSRVEAEHLITLRLSGRERAAKRAAVEAHESQLRAPFPGYGPVLPDHVLDLFADGLEPFFIPPGSGQGDPP